MYAFRWARFATGSTGWFLNKLKAVHTIGSRMKRRSWLRMTSLRLPFLLALRLSSRLPMRLRFRLGMRHRRRLRRLIASPFDNAPSTVYSCMTRAERRRRTVPISVPRMSFRSTNATRALRTSLLTAEPLLPLASKLLGVPSPNVAFLNSDTSRIEAQPNHGKQQKEPSSRCSPVPQMIGNRPHQLI